MGLGRYCDQMTLEKKIISLFFKDKQKDVETPLIAQKQERRMFAIKERLTEMRAKISEYEHFFKTFNF
jgi:hypothetical protein